MTNDHSNETVHIPLYWKVTFLFALFVILAGLNFLYEPVLNLQSITRGEPGELVYAAGFDGFADEWQLFEGRRYARMEDGVLRLGLDVPDTIYSASAPVYEDFDISVTSRATAGTLQNDGYGIIFRLDDSSANTDCNRHLAIMCVLEQLPLLDTVVGLLAPAPIGQAQGYYVFMISNDGYYQLLKGDSTTGLLEEVTIWHYSNGLLHEGIGEENRIRVVGKADQFSFFLNGEPALLCVPDAGERPTGTSEDCLGTETYVWEDDTFSTGKLGVVLNDTSGTGDIVEFDNFTVKIPDEIMFEGDNNA